MKGPSVEIPSILSRYRYELYIDAITDLSKYELYKDFNEVLAEYKKQELEANFIKNEEGMTF